MQTAQITIEGISPYSQSKYVDTEIVPKIGKETHDDYEKRTWKSRVHVAEDGAPFMPPMSLKKSLEGAAPYSGKIPGQGQATYTKRVKSGILVTDPIALFTDRGPITLRTGRASGCSSTHKVRRSDAWPAKPRRS